MCKIIIVYTLKYTCVNVNRNHIQNNNKNEIFAKETKKDKF